MPKVKESHYRHPPTPEGLKAIEKGEMKWLDTTMFANLNTGICEEYIDELNRTKGFELSTWSWAKVGLGILIGTFFALIVQYVGLKVGIAVGAAWYIVYLVGLALRWTPSENNIAGSAASAAQHISSGFIFTYPAMYLLAYHEDYTKGIILPEHLPPIGVAIIATIVSGWLGAMYFIIFRRLWVVEDTLPLPGFEAGVKLLDIANDITRGAMESAKRSIYIVAAWASASLIFTFFRDMPLMNEKPLMDSLFEGDYYHHGMIKQPESTATYTWFSFGLTPVLIGIGWFQRFRIALLVSLGTFVSWFVIVPLAVLFHVPVLHENVMTDISTLFFSSYVAYKSIARPIAIGAILGGGITALVKMFPAFKTVFKDVANAVKGRERKDWVDGKSWYEWPLSQIPFYIPVVVIVVGLVFVLGGYPPLQSFIYSGVLAFCVFFLGAIAVKVMGEVGIEPVSGTSFIALLIIIGLFTAIGTPVHVIAVMCILGTTVFACSISMSGNIIADFKAGLYVGNRPYHLMKAVLTAIVPGAIVSAVGASILSYGLATGALDFLAPQAHAFAYMVQIILGGETSSQLAQYLMFGFAVGVFMEIMTGMGTAFGLGMYFPLYTAFPLLVGGALRDIWQRSILEPKSKREKWGEREKTLKLLDSYMMATGLIVGEAVMGTIVAIIIIFM